MANLLKNLRFQIFISTVLIIFWTYLRLKTNLLNDFFFILLGTYFVFIFLVISEILIQKTKPLNIREINNVDWYKVFSILFISFLLTIAFVNWSDLHTLLDSAVVGVIVGYGIMKFDDASKERKEGERLIEALLFELSNSRYKCESIISGHWTCPDKVDS